MSYDLLTIPHVLDYNAKNFSSEIAMREKKFGVWRTKTWLEVANEVEAVAISLENKGSGSCCWAKARVSRAGQGTPPGLRNG